MMIVVAILGILTSIAIPVFRTIVLRSKTSEATANLGVMFKSAASYYLSERAAGQGNNAALISACKVADIVPATPTAQKRQLPPVAGFRAIGFTVSDFVYYSYGLAADPATGGCGGTPSDQTVYTLIARGDLDDDTTLSTFELAVGSDSSNELYHSRGLFIQDELE